MGAAEATEIWEKLCLPILKKELEESVFNTWIYPMTVGFQGKTLKLNVGNRFKKDWIVTNYNGIISNTVADTFGKEIKVEFIIKREDSTPASTKTTAITTAIAQLPLWGDEVRGTPNAILRSALCSVRSQREAYTKRTLIAAIGDYEVRIKGIRPNQTVLDVWLELIHLAKEQPLENVVEFTAHSLLKKLERNTGKSQHEQLKEEISSLVAVYIEITSKTKAKSFFGNLVTSGEQDEKTGHYRVQFNADFQKLFSDGYSCINMEQRRALGRNNLAKWLHGYYASHAEPYPLKVETIHTMCGSDTQEMFHFRAALKKALDALKKVGGIHAWKIDSNDLVHVVNVPTTSQQKHLKRKKAIALPSKQE